MQINYFYMCRVGFEFCLLRFLSVWFLKLYQFEYLLKQLSFTLINIIAYGVVYRKTFKLSQLSTLAYVQCLLFPLALSSINNFMLQNYIPLLLISTFQCFWIRLNIKKFKSPLFVILLSFTILRLFLSLPGYSLFFLILAQCVMYLIFQLNQKRHIFSMYVIFSQLVVFITSIVTSKYDSILDFNKFKVFSRNVVFSTNMNSLFLNLFYHLAVFLFFLFCTIYFISLEQSDSLRLINGVFCVVVLFHFSYNLLYFLFFYRDNGLTNFKVLLAYFLEYDTLLFVSLCLITTVIIFAIIGFKMKYGSSFHKFRASNRKFLHLLILLFCYYSFYLKTESFLCFLLSLVIILFVFIELLRINNLLFKPFAKFFTDIYKCLGHDSQVEKFELSTITMLTGVLLPILFELKNEEFDWTRASLGICTIGVGDSMASIVGCRFKGNSYNNKTIQGLIAFFLSCLGSMSLTCYLQNRVVYDVQRMLFVSLFSSIYEYLAKEEDNVGVPLLAILLYRL